MRTRLLALLVVAFCLAAGPVNAGAAGESEQGELGLSADLLALLRTEMREIAAGVGGIALSLASADWQSIRDTSARIRDSYIMKRQLTKEQAQELKQALPAHFRHLDLDFHQRAESLRVAAASKDPALVAFRYSRLLESCAACHSAYAKSRFPGFLSSSERDHHHH
jgi:hypothetical protein